MELLSMNEVKNNDWIDILEELPPSETQVQVSYKTFDDTIYCDRFAFCSPTGEWFYVNPATGEVEDFPFKVYAWRKFGEPFSYDEHLSIQFKEDVKRFKEMIYKEIPQDDYFANVIFGGVDGLGKIYVIKITSDKDTDLLNRLQYYKNRVDKQYFSDDLKRGNQIVMYCFNGDIEDCRDIAYSYFSYVRQQVIDCLDKYDNDETCDE
jgi:hypothetical protein